MVREISTDDLLAALEDERVEGLFDNRGAGSFQALHIRGSKRLGVDDVAAGRGLPSDKNAFLVFY